MLDVQELMSFSRLLTSVRNPWSETNWFKVNVHTHMYIEPRGVPVYVVLTTVNKRGEVSLKSYSLHH